jgi:AraC-like DNA-binding protein
MRHESTKRSTDTPLVDVASQSGFGDQATLTHTFRRLVGVTPGHFRREHGRKGRAL